MSGWETDKGAPLLSVIVPVYQAARYLRACVESILAQDFDDFELLLVDDGSTDGSGALCDEFGKRDRRVRVVHQENRGVTRTRERAAELAQGTLLLWVDADDTIEAGLFAGIAAVHGRTDADIILYGWRETRGGTTVREVERKDRSLTAWQKGAFLETSFYLWSYACRRSLWAGERAPDEIERAAADGYMTKHLFLKAARIEALPGVYYNYRRDNEGSITHAFTGRRLQCSAYAWYACYPLFRARFPHEAGPVAAKCLSAAVKAYSFALLSQDLTAAEQAHLAEMVRALLPEAGWRRPRDRVLAWAILHGHHSLLRRYARGKVRKEQRKAAGRRQG